MESERLAASDRTLAPNRFVVHLHPTDLAGFDDMEQTLAAELADAALLFARAHHYTLVDRPRVDLLADATVERADIRVDARFADPIAGHTSPVDHENGLDDRARPDHSSTIVFTVPVPSAPTAWLRVHEPRAHVREMPIGASLTIGRATDNDLVLRDERVSRHHGRIAGRRGTLLYSDLGSTNGSEVNGERVTEVVLGPGDLIRIGASTLEVEVDGART